MNQPSGIVFAMAQAGLRRHLAAVQIDLVKLAGAAIAAEQLLLAGAGRGDADAPGHAAWGLWNALEIAVSRL